MCALLAATNRNLKEEVNAGRFRKDLYHRLSQFELSVPPLRERLEDIVALAQHLLAQERAELTFSPEALRLLQEYAWPGNVRELRNVVNKLSFSSAYNSSVIGSTEVEYELALLSNHREPMNKIERELTPTTLNMRVIRPGA